MVLHVRIFYAPDHCCAVVRGFAALACCGGPTPTAIEPARPTGPSAGAHGLLAGPMPGPRPAPCTRRRDVNPASTVALSSHSCACAPATPVAVRRQGRSAPPRSCGCAIAIGAGTIPRPAYPGRPGMDSRLLQWRGGQARQRIPGLGPLLKQAAPRVPLN